MNAEPIIEKEGDGEVCVGFRCAACRRRFLNDSDLFQDLTKEEAETWSPFIAARDCCVCDRKDCLKPTDRPRLQYCDFCYWKLSFTSAWLRIGSAMKLGISNDLVWEIIEDQLDYGDNMHALECRLKRYEYYETAKENCEGCNARLQHARYEVVDGRWLCDGCRSQGASHV
jgi:hypothetical protein